MFCALMTGRLDGICRVTNVRPFYHYFFKTLTNQNQMLGLSYLYVTFHVRSRRYFILTNIFTVSRLSISNVRSCPFSSNLPPKKLQDNVRNQIIPTLGTKHSHVGNEMFPHEEKIIVCEVMILRKDLSSIEIRHISDTN